MAITDAVRPLGIEVRAGVHTGEVARLGDKIGGLAGSDLTFAERGSHELKGVPGVWGLYAARREGR